MAEVFIYDNPRRKKGTRRRTTKRARRKTTRRRTRRRNPGGGILGKVLPDSLMNIGLGVVGLKANDIITQFVAEKVNQPVSPLLSVASAAGATFLLRRFAGRYAKPIAVGMWLKAAEVVLDEYVGLDTIFASFSRPAGAAGELGPETLAPQDTGTYIGAYRGTYRPFMGLSLS